MNVFEREISGRRYRVLATSVRVVGRKHPVSRQVSLGPVEDEVPFVPSQCREAGFRRIGDVGALIEVADELGVLEAFDEFAPGMGTGPSLGELVLAVALQRVCEPGAKGELPEFIASSVPRFTALTPDRLTGKAFHRMTRGVDEETYDRVQLAIAKKACALYGLKTDVLAFDTTNFDTFLATTTNATLAQRGHAKSKRADLRVVGLALMTSRTGSVPLFHRTYAGNESDKTVLANTLGVLARLHRDFGGTNRTLVRDGGFAGAQLELALGEAGYRSVTVLPLSSTVAGEALREAVGHLKRLPGKLREIRSWRTREKVGDADRTLVVIESPELLAGQLRGMSIAVKKATRELRRIAKRLAAEAEGTARGRRYTLASLEQRIADLTAREHVAEVLKIELGGDDHLPTLRFAHDREARRRLIRERLGKRVLVTDQHSWSTSQIVRAFRSQWRVERAFRRMKRGGVSPWGPSFQWTDDSLRAHTFATVLGLQLASLVRLKMQRAGIRLSTRRCMKALAAMRLTRLLAYGRRGGPREILVAPRTDPVTTKAVPLFRLDRWTTLFSATRRSPAGPRQQHSPAASDRAPARK
jgi:transposase